MFRDMPTAPPNIRELRLRRGWTQADLAQQCIAKGVNVTVSTISRVEREGLGVQRAPRAKLRAALAEILGFDIDFEQAS